MRKIQSLLMFSLANFIIIAISNILAVVITFILELQWPDLTMFRDSLFAVLIIYTPFVLLFSWIAGIKRVWSVLPITIMFLGFIFHNSDSLEDGDFYEFFYFGISQIALLLYKLMVRLISDGIQFYVFELQSSFFIFQVITLYLTCKVTNYIQATYFQDKSKVTG